MPPQALGLPGQILSYLGQGLASRVFARKPLFLTLFVTGRCPLSCAHCFCPSWRASQTRPELSLDELRLIARRMPRVEKLLITGGEPTLREDLPEILEAFHDGPCAARQITLATSGIHPERLAALVDRVLPSRPGLILEIQLSIDGVGTAHDASRGAPVFSALLESHALLQARAPRFPGLRPRFNFTFSRASQEHFEETLRFVTRELGCPRLDMVLLRGSPKDPGAGGTPDLERYLLAARLLHEQEHRAASGSLLRGLLADRALEERRIIAEHARGVPILLPCSAATLFGVIREDGELLPCELRQDTLGNLRDHDYDLGRLWRADRARAFRAALPKERCFCTFETAIRTSLSFRPASYVEMLRR